MTCSPNIFKSNCFWWIIEASFSTSKAFEEYQRTSSQSFKSNRSFRTPSLDSLLSQQFPSSMLRSKCPEGKDKYLKRLWGLSNCPLGFYAVRKLFFRIPHSSISASSRCLYRPYLDLFTHGPALHEHWNILCTECFITVHGMLINRKEKGFDKEVN